MTLRFSEQVRGRGMSVVLPEGEDPRVVAAARRLVDDRIATPILLGADDAVAAAAADAGASLDGIEQVDPVADRRFEAYTGAYAEMRGLDVKVAKRVVKRPLCFGGMMVNLGDADTMVAGVRFTTASVISAGVLTVGLAEGVETPSSFFLMELPETAPIDRRTLIFADCAVNIAPSPPELADIAMASGRSAERLLDEPVRVAMLSFSTHGSAAHEAVDRVVEALELARGKAPNLAIDGEFQADSALVPAVAAKKIKRESSVAGNANVLVFPDLNSGNIAYKLTQYLAGASAVGPLLQGFAKPISDLSRGASVDDIIQTTAICLAQVDEGS